MNKLLATLIAGMFAVVSTAAMAQATAPAATDKAATDKMAADKDKMDKDKMSKTKSKFDEKSAQDLSRNSPNPADAKANVDRSKMDVRTKAKYDEKAAQSLSRESATDPAQAKANVAASKASGPRQKLPNVKDLTPEQRKQLMQELQKLSTP
jgi:hypothetical protein